MKRNWLLASLPIVISLSVALWAYERWQERSEKLAQRLSCLSAVIPSVVLHSEQDEIIGLLQELANETATQIPEKEKTVSRAFFSPAIDAELIHISKLFQKKQRFGISNETDVENSVEKVIELMTAQETPFLARCERLMSTIEKACGSLKEISPDNPSCFQKYNEKILALIPKK